MLTDTLVPRSESGKVEQLPKLVHSILWVLHRVADRPWVLKDLIVIAALVGLVTEKVDRIPAQVSGRLAVLDTGTVNESHIAKRICLVPSVREDVKRDLTTDRVGETIVRELLLESRNKGIADVVDLVVLFKLDSLVDTVYVIELERQFPRRTTFMLKCATKGEYLRSIPSDRRDVDHAISELDKSTTHDGQIELGDVLEAELGELLVLVLSQPADKALRGQLLAILERGQTVLGKDVVKLLGKVGGCDLKLLANLFEIATTDDTDDALLAQRGEESMELGCDGLACQREGTVDVEQADGARVLSIAVLGSHLERRQMSVRSQ